MHVDRIEVVAPPFSRLAGCVGAAADAAHRRRLLALALVAYKANAHSTHTSHIHSTHHITPHIQSDTDAWCGRGRSGDSRRWRWQPRRRRGRLCFPCGARCVIHSVSVSFAARLVLLNATHTPHVCSWRRRTGGTVTASTVASCWAAGGRGRAASPCGALGMEWSGEQAGSLSHTHAYPH